MSTSENVRIPTDKQKDELLNIINSMGKGEHMYIYLHYLKNMDDKIYTITNDAIIFDIADLDSNLKVFWEIYDYSILYKQDIIRKNEIRELEKNHSENIKLLENKINKDYEELKSNSIIATKYIL